MRDKLSLVLAVIGQLLSGVKSGCLLLLLSVAVITQTAGATETRVINLPTVDDTELAASVYPATGDTVLLWLACNEGSEGAETRSADILTKQGIGVWLPDFLSAHFLPQGPSSIYKVTGAEVATVIESIIKENPDKKIYLVAGGRATVPLLRGAVAWEQQNKGKMLAGALLLYPRLNLLDPVPGNDPVYVKAVGRAKLPMIIFEGERTPNRWGLPHLVTHLRSSGASVTYELLPKVRGYFYTRPEKTPAEKALSKKLPDIIKTQLDKFARL